MDKTRKRNTRIFRLIYTGYWRLKRTNWLTAKVRQIIGKITIALMCLPTLWPPGRRCLSVVKGAISCCVRVKMTLESSRWTPLPLPPPASPDVLPRAGAAVTGRRGRRRGGTRGRAVPNAEKIREFSGVARNAKHVSGTICSCKRGTFSVFIRLRPKWSYPFPAVDSCKRGLYDQRPNGNLR